MPLVKISLLKGKSKEEKVALLDAIHDALMEAFKIPENDRIQRIFEFEPENFKIPEGKASNYILIEMDVFPGRSIAAKRILYQTIVQNPSSQREGINILSPSEFLGYYRKENEGTEQNDGADA